jgi:hypothetical protein
MTDDIKSAVEAAKRLASELGATDDGDVFADAEALRTLINLASRVEKIEAETVERCLQAVRNAGWTHLGDDAYSQGMDHGAAHQLLECVKALKAIRALSQPKE